MLDISSAMLNLATLLWSFEFSLLLFLVFRFLFTLLCLLPVLYCSLLNNLLLYCIEEYMLLAWWKAALNPR